MVLFATIERLAEAIGAGERTAARKRMPEPHAHGTGQRLRIDARPVHLAGLQFHDAGDALEGFVKRTTKRHAVLPAQSKAVFAEVVAAAHRIKRERAEIQLA